MHVPRRALTLLQTRLAAGCAAALAVALAGGSKDDPPGTRLLRPRRLVLLGALGACLAGVPADGAAARAAVGSAPRLATGSVNWAGYAITGAAGSPARFQAVSANWVQPSVACSGGASHSGFWVGLGGYRRNSRALEQVGTESDCAVAGRPTYFAWYELVPRAAFRLGLKVHPGDSIAAGVTVTGRRVKLSLRDLTTLEGSTRTVRASALDVSSAEWIAEAPSICNGHNSCQVQALEDFGPVAFSNCYATSADGHAGPLGAPAWSPVALELLDVGAGPGRSGSGGSAPVGTAAPTGLTAGGSGFSVAWREASAPAGTPPAIGPPGG
jgi:hypothetical protein